MKTNNKKIALVTGGSKRIGASICEELHKSGIDVMIHYKNSKEDALNLKDKLNKIRSNSTDIVQGDLCKTESYEKIISNVIKRFGQLDYLVNNASSYFPTQIDNLNEDDWNDLISTNLKAPLFLCQAAAKFLKEKKIIHPIAGFFLSTLILGVLFKIMHWPFANFLISWSVTISLFGITPIYFASNYYAKINEDFSKEDRMKNILIGVFILVLLSLWYAMIDLSKIPNPYSIP